MKTTIKLFDRTNNFLLLTGMVFVLAITLTVIELEEKMEKTYLLTVMVSQHSYKIVITRTKFLPVNKSLEIKQQNS